MYAFGTMSEAGELRTPSRERTAAITSGTAAKPERAILKRGAIWGETLRQREVGQHGGEDCLGANVSRIYDVASEQTRVVDRQGSESQWSYVYRAATCFPASGCKKDFEGTHISEGKAWNLAVNGRRRSRYETSKKAEQIGLIDTQVWSSLLERILLMSAAAAARKWAGHNAQNLSCCSLRRHVAT